MSTAEPTSTHMDKTTSKSHSNIVRKEVGNSTNASSLGVGPSRQEKSSVSPASQDTREENTSSLASTLSQNQEESGSNNQRTKEAAASSSAQFGDTRLPSPNYLRPYAQSPTPSSTSLSQSNLADSDSLTSGAVADEDEPDTSAASLPRNGTDPVNGKKASHRLVTRFLSRTQSIRSDEVGPRPKQRTGSSSQRHLSPVIRTRTPLNEDKQIQVVTSGSADTSRSNFSDMGPSLKTAPLEPERGFRNAMGSSDHRNRSADHYAVGSGSEESRRPSVLSSTFQLGNKTIDGVRNAGGHMFRKFRASSVEKQPAPIVKKDLEVVRLPLDEQVRMTRLAKQYKDARDKTQFWLPSLPYRCIDYLNMHAVDEVGIYRQSGSRLEVDRFLSKFDTAPFDVDLLGDPDLYDVHIVSSLFKDWLRWLPEPIIPEQVQSRIHKAIKLDENKPQCPQAMKDELSDLPPQNYYLLFAITCHVSLLHSNAAKNLMTFENLVTCFMRSLQVDTSIFKYLILDWRNCWQGCRTEPEYLAHENNLERDRKQQQQQQQQQEQQQIPVPSGEAGSRAATPSSVPPAGSSSSRIENPQDARVEPASATDSPPTLQPLAPIPPMHM